MSDNFDYDDDQNEQEHPAERRIREKAEKREADELRAKLAEYERKDAVRHAGLDLNDKQLKALWAAHDGDPTPDALKSTAAALGFAKEETPAVSAEEIAAHERVAQAASPATPPPVPASALDAVLQQVRNAPVSQLSPGGELYQRTLAAIQQAGLQMGQLDHDGQLYPLS
jgi:hypothetical protein